MKLKFKKLHPDAKINPPANPGDCGYDITAVTMSLDNPMYVEYGTKLSVKIPEGYVGLLLPRSSVSNKGLSLANSCGVLDQGFLGEIRFRFYPTGTLSELYNIGDRIGQLLLVPILIVEMEEVEEFEHTERGSGSYGSTGT